MTDISRRQFFRLSPVKILKGSPPDNNQQTAVPIRPPGALSDPIAFSTTCERCGQCAEACPHDIIFHSGPETGKLEGTPYLKPDEKPCHWCQTMDCIKACPSGALIQFEDAPIKPLAKVFIQEDECLNSQGTICDDCYHFCPTHIRAIELKGRFIKLNQDRCTGCGMCISECAVTPSAIKIEPLIHTPQSTQ